MLLSNKKVRNFIQIIFKIVHSLFFYIFNIFFIEVIQNTTIEERVALLEIQVVEIEEDVTDLDQDVNFLFDQ